MRYLVLIRLNSYFITIRLKMKRKDNNMTTQPTLNTDRLILRQPEPGDDADIQRLAGKKEIAENTYMPHPYEDGMAEEFIKLCRVEWNRRNQAVFAITLKSDGSLIGTIGLKDISREHRRAEMGYWIAIHQWGKGFATEAARAVLEFAFGTLKLNRVYSGHFHTNPASGRVLQKIGMQKEGMQRRHVYSFGKYKDHVLYGILCEEWEEKTRRQVK